MSGSNQYPRLPWERATDSVHGGFIARPHGPGAGLARIYFNKAHPRGSQWIWTVGWAKRFDKQGQLAEKQDAADAATTAYWDLMTSTEGWVAPPPVRPRQADLMAVHFWRRVDAWLLQADEKHIQGRMAIYRRAAIRGPSIMSEEADRAVWNRLTDGWMRRRFPLP